MEWFPNFAPAINFAPATEWPEQWPEHKINTKVSKMFLPLAPAMLRPLAGVLAPPFIINHPETVNCCNFPFVSTFVGDFGRELSYKLAARL